MANWRNLGSRGDVDDRRGFGPVAGGLSITGVAIVLIVNYLVGGDMSDVLNQLYNQQVSQPQVIDTQQFEGADEYEVFASTVLGSTNEYWQSIFSQNNTVYQPPQLVLFRNSTQSECGVASSQVGPHYCPYDKKIYLDETFFDALVTELGASGGDVAEAYVIAHEVGHHVQNELGTLAAATQSQSKDAAINIELQADCFAGLWASSIKAAGVFEEGEIKEAMDAAAAVGDDHIQETVRGQVNPETWTHGSSEQRVAAFNSGYQSGEVAACNSYN